MTLITLEDARKIIDSTSFNVTPKECEVNISDAIGKIVVSEIRAIKSIPERSLSAMDGYAIKFNDYLKYGKFKVVGKIYPFDTTERKLSDGEAYYVTTGAPLPINADTVIPIENSKLEDDYVVFKGEVKKGKNVRERGEDVNENEVIITKGEEIKPYHLGLLIQQGIFRVKVSNLNFSIFANGNEITDFRNPESHKIPDSISPIIIKLLEKFGSVNYLGVAKDDLNDVSQMIENAIDKSDVLISIGGSSVGEKDFVKRAVNKLGEILFEGVSVNVIKRGSIGKVNGKPIIILPGQVVSAITAFHEFGLSVLSKIINVNLKKYVKSYLADDIFVEHKMDSIYLFRTEGSSAKPLKWGVGLYKELTKANSFGILKRNVMYKKGEEVELQLLL
ncbi:molybdopterin molybdenumtransferase MoeA [Sulfolobus sp. A20]|uniref:molybdopterin molybdotransferase MoeA n=1 Tax=Sulfolobaceae TaxID=118883 RepID=UPI0008460301|nr:MULTISPECIES: molybdopterin molybdotransferase MoeA [unclassified Sulfolobus]TRM74847.1 molybdopterin molybdenumtransferase MoeA [Sulfolobus sp. E5]TRM75626.1 molybdopterin molybdenumtransferase MoeA [Sulfolobus sp. A20-N-F8]TRM79162.1 molybdopterin molybdenumtransferase MoeA [Sulfolobus sp. B5]TRM87966.1 molybdopterin molybdenumtransferase MoeA [Sulfolobus sp. E3]TRM89243.1 molybdopterin molybdenumtransferase MoeA [Sulfolobus sp. C3]TRM98858.1 molybdopterin molybdenumtransferase MoeA [Sul